MEKSEKIELLVKALSKAQAEFPRIEKDKENPFYHSKYADLSTVLGAVMPTLAKHGLVVCQTSRAGDKPCLVTTLAHESGQFISGEYPLVPVKPEPQALGSAMTYARRYAICAILGVVADDDDDGNATVQKEQPKQSYQQPERKAGTITDKQSKMLYAKWKQANIPDDNVKSFLREQFGIESTRDLLYKDFDVVLNWINTGGQ